MAAAIRLARKNLGRTATNPSVGTLIVRDDGDGPVIVGRGVTAIGGRPHAETEALAEAGERARGATAYVTLEPCAHHGRTPPCANALVAAGIRRVVGAASDPDGRVSGRGYRILRDAGIEVTEAVLAGKAADQMASYLIRSVKKRPEVTLKLAISRDGAIGRRGEGQLPITGAEARAQVHLMRAESDAVLVGVGTAIADDPMLTVRLPGMGARSPARIVLDRDGRLPLASMLVATAREIPTLVAVSGDLAADRRQGLEQAGVRLLASEIFEGRIALPELLEDLAALGFSAVMVEGGADTARAFLEEGLVDRLALFRGNMQVGEGAIRSPIEFDETPAGFELLRSANFGHDQYRELVSRI